MRWAISGAVLAFAVGAGEAQAAGEPNSTVDRVESEVYEAAGTPQELASKASTCIAQNVKQVLATEATIVSTNLEGGTIVANSAVRDDGTLFGGVVRSTLTFEARPGRFRLVHTSISGLSDNHPELGWRPVTRNKRGHNAAELNMSLLNDRIARCVMSPAADW